VLDDYTLGEVIQVYTDQAGDVGLYAEQLSRWSGLNLTPSPRREVVPGCQSRSRESGSESAQSWLWSTS
jgi:hypothetical protein